jgi:hypothetical protein
MAAKRRSKRAPDGELTTGLWEGYLASQEALVARLGADGAAMARARAEALVSQGWGAVWSERGIGADRKAYGGPYGFSHSPSSPGPSEGSGHSPKGSSGHQRP